LNINIVAILWHALEADPKVERRAIHPRDTVVSVRTSLAIPHRIGSLRGRSFNVFSLRPAARAFLEKESLQPSALRRPS
jgi:hypothetical protein